MSFPFTVLFLYSILSILLQPFWSSLVIFLFAFLVSTFLFLSCNIFFWPQPFCSSLFLPHPFWSSLVIFGFCPQPNSLFLAYFSFWHQPSGSFPVIFLFGLIFLFLSCNLSFRHQPCCSFLVLFLVSIIIHNSFLHSLSLTYH